MSTALPAKWTPTRRLVLGLAFVVFGSSLVVTSGLTFPLRKDEVHFWATTTEFFSDSLLPTVEGLHAYPEVITPLSFMIWGQLDRLTGHGIVAGRSLNVTLAVCLLLMLLYGNRQDPVPGPPAALGMLVFPYFVVLSVHLFTDILGAFLIAVAVHFHLNRRLLPAFVFWVLAISARQYLVLVPAAFAVWEGLRSLLGAHRWREAAVAGLGCLSLLAWIAFFGGLASSGGMAVWIDPYPAPMLSPFEFILSYGLYFLVGIAVYFVIPEMLFFRCFPSRELLSQHWVWGIATLLAVAFLIDVPLLTEHQPGGSFGRLTRALLPSTSVGDALRALLYFGLALLTLARFANRQHLSFWILVMGFLLSMKSQIPWEKYLLPTLMVLWLLRSRNDAEGGIDSAWVHTDFQLGLGAPRVARPGIH